MARYRGKGIRYRPRGSYSSYRSPYTRRYSPYRAKMGRYPPRYRRSNPAYESEPSEQVGTQYAPPPEPTYAPRTKRQPKSEVAEESRSLLSKDEFFERYPAKFPEHWDEHFRKEVMDRMYDRYVEFIIGKALIEKSEAEEKQEVKKEEQERSEAQSLEDFEQDPQDKLLEVIKKMGMDSPEGKAAYDELLDVQLKEINKLEDEYGNREDRLEAQAPDSPHFENQDGAEQVNESNPDRKVFEAGPELQEQNQAEVKELSQAEMEQVMDHLEGELFNEPDVEPSEIEKAEHLAEQALEMDKPEIEDLVHTALEETKLESSELGAELKPELGYEVETEEEESAEVY